MIIEQIISFFLHLFSFHLMLVTNIPKTISIIISNENSNFDHNKYDENEEEDNIFSENDEDDIFGENDDIEFMFNDDDDNKNGDENNEFDGSDFYSYNGYDD